MTQSLSATQTAFLSIATKLNHCPEAWDPIVILGESVDFEACHIRSEHHIKAPAWWRRSTAELYTSLSHTLRRFDLEGLSRDRWPSPIELITPTFQGLYHYVDTGVPFRSSFFLDKKQDHPEPLSFLSFPLPLKGYSKKHVGPDDPRFPFLSIRLEDIDFAHDKYIETRIKKWFKRCKLKYVGDLVQCQSILIASEQKKLKNPALEGRVSAFNQSRNFGNHSYKAIQRMLAEQFQLYVDMTVEGWERPQNQPDISLATGL